VIFKEKLNQWNLIIKEYILRMNMGKTVNMRISRNVGIKINDTLVTEVDKFVYLRSGINLFVEGKTDGEN
jgi:hypothetical protein